MKLTHYTLKPILDHCPTKTYKMSSLESFLNDILVKFSI